MSYIPVYPIRMNGKYFSVGAKLPEKEVGVNYDKLVAQGLIEYIEDPKPPVAKKAPTRKIKPKKVEQSLEEK